MSPFYPLLIVSLSVALQREGYEQRVQSPIDLSSTAPSLRQSQAWPNTEDSLQVRLEEIPKKKKKGLAKLWKSITGSKEKGHLQAGAYNSQIRSFDRHEDDLPLAPPPPLSYLVERGPGEHNVPGPRQSTISLPSITSPKNGFSSPAVSPATPPSSLLLSPAPSRASNGEPEIAGESRRPSWNHDEHERSDPLAEEGSKLASPRNLHTVTSEPDIRRPQEDSPSPPLSLSVQRPLPPLRPQSMLSREKSLPALPDEVGPRPPANKPDMRPQTVYTYDPRQIPPGASPPVQDLAAPRAPFRNAENRRQSLGGMTSRPNLAAQTMPTTGVYAQDLKHPGVRYNEFGSVSRRSLGYMEHIQDKPRPGTPSKRKSKFGLASLLGRKSQMYDGDLLASPGFGSPRLSTSDGRDDAISNGGYAHSGSRHSTVGPRMSVMSRKAIEEFVEQDPNFVAYRYPSSDQRLDLLR